MPGSYGVKLDGRGGGVRRCVNADSPLRKVRLLAVVLMAGCPLAACGSSTTADAVPGSTKVLVALPLSVQSSALGSLADAVANSNSPQYHQFVSIPGIASRYGASTATIDHDLKILRGDGIDLGVDPTHGALWGEVSAAQVRAEFDTTLVVQNGVIQPQAKPRVPGGLEGVTGVVGLSASSATTAAVIGGSSSPACPAEAPTRTSVATVYGFSSTVAAGFDGAGTTIDIVADHAFEPATFFQYTMCTGVILSTKNISSSSVPLTPSAGGGPEVSLDTLVLTLLAPTAHLHVTEFDSAMPLAFPLMSALSSGSTPNVLDMTFTYCEPEVAAPARQLSEWLLAAFAASGTTSVAATGDTGSSGCYPAEKTPDVTYPASSAYVTAVGGVSYSGSITKPVGLEAWNHPGTSGGGGGISGTITAPPWQPPGHRRLPDVSAEADPGAIGDIPVCRSPTDCQWIAAGGTSVAATVLGATGILLAERHGTASGPARWGNLAEPLWQRGATASSIIDVTNGANTTFDSKCCTASKGYDLATGWGLFDPDAIAATLSTR